MNTSKAHAVQTSARVSMPVERDMFAVDQLEPPTGEAFQHEGRCVRDAHAILQQLEGHGEPAPVVPIEIECGHGGLIYRVTGTIVFPCNQMAAAQAKAAHCRKGALIRVNGSMHGVTIRYSSLQRVQVLEGRPQ